MRNPALLMRIDPDVMDITGLGRTTLFTMVAKGELPGVIRFGRTVRVHREVFLDWLKTRAAEPRTTISGSP